VARKASALFEFSDHELERRRQELAFAVIWGKAGASPELQEVERELDRRARLREEERRARATAAGEEAWRRIEGDAERDQGAEEVADAVSEEGGRAEDERARAEEEQRLAEEERLRAEQQQREEEERRREEEERRRSEEELVGLAAEQLLTAKLLDFGAKRIVELAADYVEREDAMHALAESIGLIGPESADAADEPGRFSQAHRLLGDSLRARLAAIPSLRLQADPSPKANGANGQRSSLEARTRSILADLLREDD
jgi:hypothetical protein